MSIETPSLLDTTIPHPDLSDGEIEPVALIQVADVPNAHTSGEAVRTFLLLADTAARAVDSALGRRGSLRRWIVRDLGTSFELLRVRSGEVETVARLNRNDEPVSSGWLRDVASAEIVELRLDQEKIVRQRFSLPAESRDIVGQIIDHRLERLTPWNAKDVLYGYAVRTGSGRNGQLEIDFASTSREIASEALRHLARLGIAPTAIGSSSEPDAEPLAVNILTSAPEGRQTRRRRFLKRILVLGLPATICICLTSFVAQWHAREESTLTSAALVQLQLAVQARAANGESRQADVDALAAKTLDHASFALLDRLAEAIPDNTYLTDIEISPLLVRLKGRSADAPALIPILEGRAGLRSVQFESPVVREANGDDRFDIVAQRMNANGTTQTAIP